MLCGCLLKIFCFVLYYFFFVAKKNLFSFYRRVGVSWKYCFCSILNFFVVVKWTFLVSRGGWVVVHWWVGGCLSWTNFPPNFCLSPACTETHHCLVVLKSSHRITAVSLTPPKDPKSIHFFNLCLTFFLHKMGSLSIIMHHPETSNPSNLALVYHVTTYFLKFRWG